MLQTSLSLTLLTKELRIPKKLLLPIFSIVFDHGTGSQNIFFPSDEEPQIVELAIIKLF